MIGQFESPSIIYVHTDDLSLVYDSHKRFGVIVLCGRDEYIWLDDAWVLLGSWDESSCEPENHSLPINCKNCGAPLHGHECEYCGTRY